MLALWPIVAVLLYRRVSPSLAFTCTLLGGYLILPPLPATFDFPIMPPLHKENIPALAAFVIVLATGQLKGSLWPENRVGRSLLAVFVLSPVATVLFNSEPVFWGELVLPALGLKDALALSISQFLLVLPFLLARQFLNTAGSQRQLIFAFLIGGLVYSIPVLAEVRLSPQLNVWTYGFFSGTFHQTVRFGGWRPTVFLYHGLWVAFFMMMALVAAAAVFKFEKSKRWMWIGATLYLGVILVACKSLGSLIFAVFLLPVVLLLGVQNQIRVAALLALLAFFYPIFKGTEVLPSQVILTQAERIDEERAGSLRFRFYNEDILLDRAYEKPVFGWGSWGRNHIWNPYSGALETTTDGRWIITLGVYGWVGFLAEFGLICLPIFLLWRVMRRQKQEDISPYIGPLSLLLGINAVDMIPNATITPLTWILSGALLGYAEALNKVSTRVARKEVARWKPIMQ
ncbi:hypothetical protein [Primorskyibacter sp. S187A]|uniref:hypothetical protein n=1 Tax=Primorskyibacter sp. S187A TaxID=3415130 RepID=UPI003C7D264A